MTLPTHILILAYEDPADTYEVKIMQALESSTMNEI